MITKREFNFSMVTSKGDPHHFTATAQVTNLAQCNWCDLSRMQVYLIEKRGDWPRS
ncbi:MAG: hypothetical protein AB1489_25555 [Acidobacteriota bacterium]